MTESELVSTARQSRRVPDILCGERVHYETLTETDWNEIAKIWDLLDEGEADGARQELRTRFRVRMKHPDVRIVDAAISIEEGDPAHALEVLDGAERSADPALFFHLRGLANFDLCRFDDARADAARALVVRPEFPDAHDLMSRTLEHRGDYAGAAEHATAAAELDSERFPLPLEMSDTDFDQLVERSLAELPEPIRKHLEELPVLIERLPTAAILGSENPPLPPDVLGLFVGRDLMSRTSLDVATSPGAIYLFRRNLLRFCHTLEELQKEVRVTVQHEVGHLLGLDEDDLDRWGLA